MLELGAVFEIGLGYFTAYLIKIGLTQLTQKTVGCVKLRKNFSVVIRLVALRTNSQFRARLITDDAKRIFDY